MKFKVGNEVKIISKDPKMQEYVGMTGLIEHVSEQEGNLVFIDENKVFWFDDDELELIKQNKVVNSNIELHRKILDEIHDTYKRKNADYGNSFEEQFKEYGLLSSQIRLDDKMRRLKQLSKEKAQVKDESIRDTLMDLANYAIMTVMELDKKNEQLQ
jgi:hypothetical protein